MERGLGAKRNARLLPKTNDDAQLLATSIVRLASTGGVYVYRLALSRRRDAMICEKAT